MTTHIVSNYLKLGLFLALVILPATSAWAQQNPGAYGGYSGLINEQVRRQIFLEKNMPYLTRPIQPEDLRPGPSEEEPVILYSEQGVKGKVVPKVPSADEIHVK